jgi:hypothetical protein
MGIIRFILQFFTYAFLSLEFLLIPPLLVILGAACVSLALANQKQRPLQSPHWKRSHWLVLTQLLFFPIVISIGVLSAATGPSLYHVASRANTALNVLVWFSLLLAAFWIYQMKGFRWFAVSLAVVIQVILMGAFFVSGMAVTGDWL